MKLINPSVELLPQPPGLEGIYKQIELAGRTCYKSTDKITDSSAKPFVDKLIQSKHLAMLEHATVYLKIPHNESAIADSYKINPFSTVKVGESCCYVTTNYRVLVERDWTNDLRFLCTPTKHHSKRITLKFITSIGVSRECNRHKLFCVA